MSAHIPLAKRRALSGRSSPGIVVGFSTYHTHSLRFWNPKTKRITTRGTIKFLGPNPQPTITFQYSTDHFRQPSQNNDSLLLSPHSPSMDSPVNTPSEFGGTVTSSLSFMSASTTHCLFEGKEEDLEDTDCNSVDIAPYRTISKRYHRGCQRKYFQHIGKSFHDSSVDDTFRIVHLTYNPDFKEKYFYKYYDVEKYQDPPMDDSLFDYTSAVGLFSDPNIVFFPNTPPVVETLAHQHVPHLTWLQFDSSVLMSVLPKRLWFYLVNPEHTSKSSPSLGPKIFTKNNFHK